MRQVPRRLDREEKARRRRPLPVRDRVAVRQAVEGVVHLDRVEVPRVVLEPEARGQPVVELVLPARVVPAGAAYADSASASCRHSSAFPLRRRVNVPRGRARPPSKARGSSKSSIASPASRTRSCAAAMSTERAPFSEHTASTRPAARWQSESASEPMMRSRYASSATFGASRAISDVSVASKREDLDRRPSVRRVERLAVQRRALAAPRDPFLAACRSRRRSRSGRRPSSRRRRRRSRPRRTGCRASRSASRRSGRSTTTVAPSPSRPTSSETIVTSSSARKRARIASSAALSIAVVSSPPRPRPTTGSRSLRVGSSSSTRCTSSTDARQTLEPVGHRREKSSSPLVSFG